MRDRSILIVDDERDLADILATLLKRKGYAVDTAYDLVSARRKVNNPGSADLILLDLCLPPTFSPDDGVRFLEETSRNHKRSKVIVMTGKGKQEEAKRCISLGAHDFLDKTIAQNELEVIVARALAKQAIEDANQMDHAKLYQRALSCSELIGSSRAMQKVREKILLYAVNDENILITGETGTGKSLVAKAIHRMSPRCALPFIEVNCGSVPRELLESELFGHEKGSFTGSTERKIGLFERSGKGTIFLDEISEMLYHLQVKILHAVEKKIRRVGGHQAIHVPARVIAATNKDLAREVEAGRFRSDLYYRLHILNIEIPPLREREGDIRALAYFFLNKFAGEKSKPLRCISEKTMNRLESYHWPGNVRELQHLIKREVVLADEHATVLDIREIPTWKNGEPAGETVSVRKGLFDCILKEEVKRIEEALRETGGNKRAAARLLGIPEASLRRKIKKYFK